MAKTRLHVFRLLLCLVAAAGVVAFVRTVGLLDLCWGEPRMVRLLCTAAAATGLTVGSIAAMRGRVNGLLLSATASASFGAAWALGIAPDWFAGVAGLGGLTTGLGAGALARRDRFATAVLVASALSLGLGTALAAGPGLDALGLFDGPTASRRWVSPRGLSLIEAIKVDRRSPR